MENASLVESAISELVGSQSVVEVPFVPHVVNPLSVLSGKKRLILDLRNINQTFGSKSSLSAKIGGSCYHIPTKAMSLSVLILSLVIIILIFPDHQTLLGFSCFFLVLSNIFALRVLPFGLSSAPYIFTKCLRLLVKFWRIYGVKTVVFLDDHLQG